MKKDADLGNAFLDVVLVGVILVTIGVVVDLGRGDGIETSLLVAAVVFYGAYLLGALRAGASPLGYLRTVTKRGSLPRS